MDTKENETCKLAHRPINLGPRLARLRDDAGIKSRDLAARLQIHPSQLSKAERADHEPEVYKLTDKQVTDYLHHIKSPQALLFLRYLQMPWSELSIPPGDHPDLEILIQAERTLQEIKTVRDDLPPVLQPVVQVIEERLRDHALYLLRQDHSLAFIGKIGAGKSAAIAMIAALRVGPGGAPPGARLNHEAVLELNSGRTTVCEVIIEQGPQYGITIEPETDEGVRRYVADLCLKAAVEITQRLGDEGETKTNRDAFGIVPEEVERVLRSMAELPRPTDGTSEDPLHTLAREVLASGDQKALVDEILARINLGARQRREVWLDPSSGVEPMKWLKDQFRKINHGRHPEVGLPRQISVRSAAILLPVPGLHLSLVDTRGIAENPHRPDLQRLRDDPRTLMVLISRFPSAPDDCIREVWEAARELQVPDLSGRSVMLILHRHDEALQLTQDDGEPVSDTASGCRLKRAQMQSELLSMHAENVPTVFFDAAKERSDEIAQRLGDQLLQMRKRHEEQIRVLADSFHSLVQNREEAAALKAHEQVTRQLQVFVQGQSTLSARKKAAGSLLLERLIRAHPSTIRAAIRWAGDWHNLPFGHLLAEGEVLDAQARALSVFHGLGSLLRTFTDDASLEAAHKYARQIEGAIPKWRQAYQDQVRNRATVSYSFMAEDHELWRRCLGEWGGGPGFRSRVYNHLKTWLEAKEQAAFRTALEGHVQKCWTDQVVRPLQDLQAQQ